MAIGKIELYGKFSDFIKETGFEMSPMMKNILLEFITSYYKPDESPSAPVEQEGQEEMWEDIDEIKEDQSPYAALLHIKQNFNLTKK